jgi:chromosome segregation ATPase
MKPWPWIAVLALASPAFAQPAETGEGASTASSSCEAEEAALERDMDLARSRGQMLRRRQLAEKLDALRARCLSSESPQSRAARIDKLERDIRALRAELEHAETQLRELKNERP